MTDDHTAALQPLRDTMRALRPLLARRDEQIRAARDAGVPQAAIVAETGLNRETIRVICLPAEKREEIRRRRRKQSGGQASEERGA